MTAISLKLSYPSGRISRKHVFGNVQRQAAHAEAILHTFLLGELWTKT
jgi:hypothetical protein